MMRLHSHGVLKRQSHSLDMPFLDSVESADAMAVWDLSYIAGIAPNDFLDIMGHPKVSDGITNQEAKVVAVLSSAYDHKSALLPVLLDGLDGTRGVFLEERVIQLPLAGETLLTIIPDPGSSYLQHGLPGTQRSFYREVYGRAFAHQLCRLVFR